MRRADRTESIAKFEAELFANAPAIKGKRSGLLLVAAGIVAVLGLTLWGFRMKATAPGASGNQQVTAAPVNNALRIDGPRAAQLLERLGVSTLLSLDEDGRVSREALLALVARSPRRVSLGSTDAEIDAAVALCGKYATQCERQQFEDEASRKVNLQPYALDATLVTFADFQEFVARTRYRTGAEIDGVAYTESNGSLAPIKGGSWRNGVGAKNLKQQAAVVGVTFDDAVTYCRDRSKRLPTEDEWEYVARGPDGMTFPWGNDVESSVFARDDQPLVTAGLPQGITGRYRGLAGNAWQWVDTEIDRRKLLKGGSWRETNPANKRAALRGYELASRAHDNTSFRCAQTSALWPDAEYWIDQIATK